MNPDQPPTPPQFRPVSSTDAPVIQVPAQKRPVWQLLLTVFIVILNVMLILAIGLYASVIADLGNHDAALLAIIALFIFAPVVWGIAIANTICVLIYLTRFKPTGARQLFSVISLVVSGGLSIIGVFILLIAI